jgi:ABC-type Na+ efflux pump permease subunit
MRRDLLAASRNAGVMAPMIIVPLVFVIILPLAAFSVSQTGADLPRMDALMDILPEEIVAGLPSDEAARLAVILVQYVFPILLVVVPLLVASVIAADAIAGERERDTFEGLLLAPVRDREILTGKLLGAFVPALVIGIGASVVYAVIVNVLLGSEVDGLVLPTASWLLIVLWFGPAFTAAALGFTVWVSARSKSLQGASQISGVAVLPLVAMTIGQVGGLVLLEWRITIVMGIVLWLLAAGLVVLGSRVLARERQSNSLS